MLPPPLLCMFVFESFFFAVSIIGELPGEKLDVAVKEPVMTGVGRVGELRALQLRSHFCLESMAVLVSSRVRS